jgi:hypothetical protein
MSWRISRNQHRENKKESGPDHKCHRISHSVTLKTILAR